MARCSRFSGWDYPRRLFKSATRIPDTSYEEQQTGWPAYLCGGWLEMEYEDAEYINDDYMEGTIPILWASDEDDDGEIVAIDAFTAPLEPWDNHTRDHSSLRLAWFTAASEQRRRGRPVGSKNRIDGSKVLPQAPAAYRSAVIDACREAFARARPPIAWQDLERVLGKILDRGSLPPPAPPAGWSGEREDFKTVWLPKLNSFSELREWAFAWSLPKDISRREAVVRAFEFQLYVTGLAQDAAKLRRSNLLALASLAALAISGEKLLRRGKRGESKRSGYRYTLSMAVAAEERAIRFDTKRIAQERLRRVEVPLAAYL